MRRLLLACSVVLCACAGDVKSTLDAAVPAPGTFGAACATVSNTSTECMSGVCTGSIDMVGHPVCSQTCTFGMNDTCPAGSNGAKMCNMKGFCKP
jgi:hypothetical protein